MDASGNLRFYVVFVFVRFGWCFHRIALAHDGDITFQVAFGSSVDVVRIGEHRPLVVELVIWSKVPILSSRHRKVLARVFLPLQTSQRSVKYAQLEIDLEGCLLLLMA